MTCNRIGGDHLGYNSPFILQVLDLEEVMAPRLFD
jgi:hypothetical protein